MIERTKGAGLPEEGGFHLLIDGDLGEKSGHVDFENGVHDREQSHEKKIVLEFELGGEQFAKAGAGHAHEHEFAAALLGGADGDDEANPAAQFALAEDGHGVANGLDFQGHTKEWRIQIAQQAIADGRFLLEHFLQFAQLDFGTRHHFEQAQVVQPVGGNFASDDDFRLAEEIALEVSKPSLTGFMKFVLVLNFFREHPAFWRAKAVHHGDTFFDAGGAEVDFDNVGEAAEREARIVRSEVVQSDHVAGFFEAFAGGDDAVFRLYGFKNLDHGVGGRQEGNEILEQNFAGAIHKGAAVVAKRAHAKQQRTVEHGTGGGIGIGIEEVFNSVAKQKFIAENVLRPIENGLARHETLAGDG